MTERVTIRVVSAEVVREGSYLLTQRSARAVLPLLWEFPGGRVRDDETDHEALARALRERLGLRVSPGHKVLEVRHEYADYAVILAVYRTEIGDQEPAALAVNAVAWVAPDDFADYPFPGADRRTIELLLRDS